MEAVGATVRDQPPASCRSASTSGGSTATRKRPGASGSADGRDRRDPTPTESPLGANESPLDSLRNGSGQMWHSQCRQIPSPFCAGASGTIIGRGRTARRPLRVAAVSSCESCASSARRSASFALLAGAADPEVLAQRFTSDCRCRRRATPRLAFQCVGDLVGQGDCGAAHTRTLTTTTRFNVVHEPVPTVRLIDSGVR